MKYIKHKENPTSFKKGQAPWNKGVSNSGFKKGYIPWNKGMKMDIEFRRKTSEGLKGRKAWNKGLRIKNISNDKHPGWKGSNAGYAAIHNWINRKLGKPIKCSNDLRHKAKLYVWANVSGEYKRDFLDWHELCQSCNLLDGVRKNKRFLK